MISLKTQQKCDSIMDKFLILDKNEHLPPSITWHLLICKKCRTQVRFMTKAEKAASSELKEKQDADNEEINAIMKKILESKETPETKPVTLIGWIIAGILMTAFMFSFVTLTTPKTSSALVIPFYLLFALIITAYCAIFVAVNLDFFVKKINSFHR